MILITTSRRPVQRIRTLCNDLRRVLPKTRRINRGKLSLNGITEKAVEMGAHRIIIIERWKGGAGKIQLYTVTCTVKQFFPIIYLAQVKTQDDVNGRRRIHGNLAVTVPHNAAPQIMRLAHALSLFLEVPIVPERSIEDRDLKSALHVSDHKRHFAQIAFTMPPRIVDIGPILTIKQMVWNTH